MAVAPGEAADRPRIGFRLSDQVYLPQSGGLTGVAGDSTVLFGPGQRWAWSVDGRTWGLRPGRVLSLSSPVPPRSRSSPGGVSRRAADPLAAGHLLRVVSADDERTLTFWSGGIGLPAVHPRHPLIAVRPVRRWWRSVSSTRAGVWSGCPRERPGGRCFPGLGAGDGIRPGPGSGRPGRGAPPDAGALVGRRRPAGAAHGRWLLVLERALEVRAELAPGLPLVGSVTAGLSMPGVPGHPGAVSLVNDGALQSLAVAGLDAGAGPRLGRPVRIRGPAFEVDGSAGADRGAARPARAARAGPARARGSGAVGVGGRGGAVPRPTRPRPVVRRAAGDRPAGGSGGRDPGDHQGAGPLVLSVASFSGTPVAASRGSVESHRQPESAGCRQPEQCLGSGHRFGGAGAGRVGRSGRSVCRWSCRTLPARRSLPAAVWSGALIALPRHSRNVEGIRPKAGRSRTGAATPGRGQAGSWASRTCRCSHQGVWAGVVAAGALSPPADRAVRRRDWDDALAGAIGLAGSGRCSPSGSLTARLAADPYDGRGGRRRRSRTPCPRTPAPDVRRCGQPGTRRPL